MYMYIFIYAHTYIYACICMYAYMYVWGYMCAAAEIIGSRSLENREVDKSANKCMGVITSSAAVVESGCKIRVEFQE